MNELTFSEIHLNDAELQMLRDASKSPIESTDKNRPICRSLCSFKLMTPTVDWSQFVITKRGRQYLAWLEAQIVQEKRETRRRWIDRGVGFISGVVSTVAAQLIVRAIIS